ncbi:MAG: hypothetical protein KF787_10290 [Phycisphaeraceae bacterium]|nr:hypothetical protein [Phycisphaerae bacterium]MBX3393023.1 hypothetical protein [Phycisphaeraceae bacterium]
MRSIKSSCVVAVVLFAGLTAAPSLAGTITFSLDVTKYGKVANSGDQCGPTSTANSFAFLQNMYPDVYKDDNRIIRDKDGAITADVAKLRDALAQGWGDKTGGRKGMGTTGVQLKEWWASKVTWLEDFAPGKTRYAAQMFNETNTDGWPKKEAISPVYPTFKFMWDALNHGAAIELNLIDVPFKNGHAVSLIGMSFDDTNNDKTWNQGEKIFMKFVDPNDPNGTNADNIQPVELTYDATKGRFEFTWWQDKGRWYIDSALTETPVPGPATWLMAAMGVGLCARRRRG